VRHGNTPSGCLAFLVRSRQAWRIGDPGHIPGQRMIAVSGRNLSFTWVP